MKIILKDEQAHETRYFADNCFYIIPQENNCVLCSSFDEVIDYIHPRNRVLDPVALFSLLLFGYVCGDRTMVRGLIRIPLHAIIDSKGEIVRERQLTHGCKIATINEIAKKLLNLLTEEIDSVVRNESEVAILLSGGLERA